MEKRYDDKQNAGARNPSKNLSPTTAREFSKMKYRFSGYFVFRRHLFRLGLMITKFIAIGRVKGDERL